MLKKNFLSCGFMFAVMAAFSGCTNGGGGDIVLPDIASFAVTAAPLFAPGGTDSITITSSTLTAGGYEVCYNLTGANASAHDTAIFAMNNGVGTFATPVLHSPGVTTITITTIINGSTGYSSVTKKNTATFSDSTGSMACTLKGSLYKVADVHATLTGSVLTIKGTQWSPLTDVYFSISNYAAATGTTAFNITNATGSNGSAAYVTGTDTVRSQYGTVTITGTSPLITGTFSFTGRDSSKVSAGTFSCPAP